MAILRLLPANATEDRDGSDVFGCAYTPDSAFVLTAAWDGVLRVRRAPGGEPVNELRLGTKPLSACATSPDGKHWFAAALDGMLGQWDAATGHQEVLFLAHLRPVSALAFSPDGQTLATAAWDGQVTLWPEARQRNHRTLPGHGDIVAGCCFTPDGRSLLSWGHDRSIRRWDPVRAVQTAVWAGHEDRVTAGAVAPDGRWFASGGRDRLVKLWDLQTGRALGSTSLATEVRACLFLLDGEGLLAIDADGRITIHALPGLERLSELVTEVAVQCARLAPNGAQLVLGGAGGAVRFVAIDGFDSAPLAVTATRASRVTKTLLGRLTGRQRETSVYVCTCPACRRSFELPSAERDHPSPCPGCCRRLRVCAVV